MDKIESYPLVMTVTVRHAIDDPNRNRWFTVLKHRNFPWRTVSHNQMLSWFKAAKVGLRK